MINREETLQAILTEKNREVAMYKKRVTELTERLEYVVTHAAGGEEALQHYEENNAEER